MLRLAVIVLLIALTTPEGKAKAQQTQFTSPSLPGLTTAATVKATIFRPEGAGPFPAVIVLHDCGGLKQKDTAWAKRLSTWGYVALLPDSFGSRGVGSVCTNALAVGAAERVQDVIGAADYLATLPYVRKDSVGVLGFSHGGWTIMKGVQENSGWAQHGIKAAVAYYPHCTAPSDGNVAIPLRILAGEKDDWTPARQCTDVITIARNPALIEATIYPDAYHSFDCDCPTRFVQGVGAGGRISTRRIEGNSSVTRDAERQTKAFFGRFLH